MTDQFNIKITSEMAGMRLDKILAEQLPDISRSRLKNLIKEGHVIHAGPQSTGSVKSPSRTVRNGDEFSVTIPEPETAIPEAQNIPLDIIYEDKDLIVVNKPAGMVVHPAPGNTDATLVNALLYHCGDSLSGIGGVRRPGIVHRIDKDTSGLLVMAKNDKAHNGLAKQFEDHSIERVYTAVCRGHPNPALGRIEGNIARHPVDRKKMAVSETGGKWAATHYKTVSNYQHQGSPLASLIECQLETGRTHQVRVHMAHIGHALIGDPVYSRGKWSGRLPADLRGKLMGFTRQALHARVIGFIHPILGTPFKFEIEFPHDIQELIHALDLYQV